MLDLEELELLAKAATPGPWRHDPDENFLDHDCQIIKGDTVFVCEFVTEANAAYIVAACNAVPELIARVRELERQRDWLADRLTLSCHLGLDCSKLCPVPYLSRCTAISREDWVGQAAKEAGE